MARTEFLVFLSVFLLSVINVQSEKCVQKSPCSCEYEDGRKIDLESLAGKPILTTSDVHNTYNLTYYFQPCKNVKPVLPPIKNLPNDCDSTSLCLLNTTTVNSTIVGTPFNLGSAADVKFTNGADTEKYLLYDHNKYNITTMIRLVCSPDFSDSILVFRQIDSKTHNLLLISEAICPVFEQHAALSTGAVLVILLFTFISVYLLGGGAILYLLRGARGREMIPNYEFWSNLPGLVRDGAVFLQNGCKPNISTSESYDRI